MKRKVQHAMEFASQWNLHPTPPPPPPLPVLLMLFLFIYSTVLSVKNFDEIFKTMRNSATKWKRIGKGLGFKKKVLDKISNTNALCTFEDDLRDLVYEWLTWAPPENPFPNQKDLATVLRGASLGQPSLLPQDTNTLKNGQ